MVYTLMLQVMERQDGQKEVIYYFPRQPIYQRKGEPDYISANCAEQFPYLLDIKDPDKRGAFQLEVELNCDFTAAATTDLDPRGLYNSVNYCPQPDLSSKVAVIRICSEKKLSEGTTLDSKLCGESGFPGESSSFVSHYSRMAREDSGLVGIDTSKLNRTSKDIKLENTAARGQGLPSGSSRSGSLHFTMAKADSDDLVLSDASKLNIEAVTSQQIKFEKAALVHVEGICSEGKLPEAEPMHAEGMALKEQGLPSKKSGSDCYNSVVTRRDSDLMVGVTSKRDIDTFQEIKREIPNTDVVKYEHLSGMQCGISHSINLNQPNVIEIKQLQNEQGADSKNKAVSSTETEASNDLHKDVQQNHGNRKNKESEPQTPASKKIKLSASSKRYLCQLCPAHFMMKRGIVSHILNDHVKCRCTMCGQVFEGMLRFETHVEDDHGITRLPRASVPYIPHALGSNVIPECPLCKEQCSNYSALNAHIKTQNCW